MTTLDVLLFQQLMFSIAALAVAVGLWSLFNEFVVKPMIASLERRRDASRRRRTYRAVGR